MTTIHYIHQDTPELWAALALLARLVAEEVAQNQQPKEEKRSGNS